MNDAVLEAEKALTKTFYREMKIRDFQIYVTHRISWFVACFPWPSVERKEVCKHTLFQTFDKIFETL